MPDSFISDSAILLSRVLNAAVYVFFYFFQARMRRLTEQTLQKAGLEQLKSKLPQAFWAKS